MYVKAPVFVRRISTQHTFYSHSRILRLRSWLPVEAVCAGLGSDGGRSLAAAEGRELILFGGKVGQAWMDHRFGVLAKEIVFGEICFVFQFVVALLPSLSNAHASG